MRVTGVIVTASLMAALGVVDDATAQCVEGCTTIQFFQGEAAGDQFGWVSNCIGDVDGDGINDLVLTAPTNDAGGGNAGRVYAYSGKSGKELWRATGGGANWWLGHDAAPAGDVNGDSVPDVIVGAPFSGAGRAIVYSGDDGAVIQTFNGTAAGEQFGYRVWGGKDFDGDGVADMVVGSPSHDVGGNDRGRASFFSGDTLALICTVDGPLLNARFGSGVALIGDVTGDGRSEAVIGAQNAFTNGRAYVVSRDGVVCGTEYQVGPGPSANNFGLWFMNGCHDVDLDGTPDFYVNDYAVNRAYVFSGVDGATLHTLSGDGNGQFGIGRLVEDVNGDGHADLILAAWISGAGASQAGKAFVYSGLDGSVLETFTHNVAGAGWGFDANGMGDVNGDGNFDYLITAALDNANSGRGRAWIIAGTVAPVDFDGDGDVDVDDLVHVILNWGDCPKGSNPCIGDTNDDGVINVEDLTAVILNWG